ncbi:MAG: hypothetical protein MJ252_11565 [archaeon]|nr:hypothetical protein [archaeon]
MQENPTEKSNDLSNIISNLVKDQNKLSKGYDILNQFASKPDFYVNLLKIAFSTQNSKEKKLSSIAFISFLKKNYEDEKILNNENKLNIVGIFLSNLENEDYFLKNFIAKSLGFIAGKEFPNCYEGFIKILLTTLDKSSTNETTIDTILRILTQVLTECDDACAAITGDVLPIILNVFKRSKDNQKNREKCLIIISLLLNKLSYADGNDMDLLSKSLDSNSLMENSISLFTSILVSNPKLLLDIKKQTIRILDILVRDMPIYSCKFFNLLIEPCWRLIVLESSLYGDSVIFNNQIEYTDEEEITMEEENHQYERGYESDDEEEKYGMEGVITELIDFSVDLLKRTAVMEALRPALFSFLLCVKNYLLMPYNSMKLWKHNPNLYISEEYDEENVNTIRNKTLGLIREISKEIEDEPLVNFIRLIIDELINGIKMDNYKDVVKLDDYNLVTPYFEKMNKDKKYKQSRQESNLLLLGTVSDEILRLKEEDELSKEEIEKLFDFLLKVISNPEEDSSVLVGRAIWTISKLLCLVRNDNEKMKIIFNSVSQTFIHPKSDLSIKLISAQCMSIICQRMIAKKMDFQSDNLFKVFDGIIDLLNKVNEDTIFIPIDNILYLTKLSPEKSLYVPLNHISPVLKVYASNYNDGYIGGKLLDLIKIWCSNKESANALLDKFIPIAIKVFEEFYKETGNKNSNFEMVKNTVMTEHSNPDVKASVDILPNLIEIITMLTKFSSETHNETNLKWISLIVKVLADILISSTDVNVLQSGSSFLRFYIALCKDTIVKENQVPLVLNVINKYFDPTLLESSMLYLGNVISQFFFHIENKIIPSVLESLVKRIYKAKMPSVVQSLILVYSRFLSKFPVDTLNFLISIQVENRVGLKVLIDKWLLHQPLFRGKYFKNISIKALSNLYAMKNSIVESLMVIGYNPSHSTASVEVNAPLKILSVLIRCLNNEVMQEKVKKEKKTNYDDMDKDEDDDYNGGRMEADYGDDDNEDDNEEVNKIMGDDEDNDKKLDIGEDEFKNIVDDIPRDFSSKLSFLNNQGQGGGLGNLEQGSEIYLTEMLGFDYNDLDEGDDENTEDDLIYLTDIEMNFVLKDYLYDWFRKFKEQDEEYLTECLKLLPKEDQKMYKSLAI